MSRETRSVCLMGAMAYAYSQGLFTTWDSTTITIIIVNDDAVADFTVG